MTTFTNVAIVIQARSTSTRFPRKIFEKIGNKQILQHVLDACSNSASYINKFSAKHGIVCGVSIACPNGDPLINHYSREQIIEGPEHDVLRRYALAQEKLAADYVVRITSDCPFIPPYVVSKAINLAVTERLDYLTNADPRFRTAPDGHDVEVISKKLLSWLDENAKDEIHREHVTTYLHDHLPEWAVKADIVGFADYSGVKLSVDTPEDLKRITEMYHKLYSIIKTSPKSFRL
jgi:spore coat polysaccharide biosynthesis protein SpsF (cytidylyltransferase family)